MATKKLTKKELKQIIKDKAKEFSEETNNKITENEFKSLISKCVLAGSAFPDEKGIEEWFHKRFKPFIFELDLKTYSKVVIEALKIQFLIAGTDFGSSRQRDFGQKWADTIRGYLGEFGVKQWIEKNFPDIKIFLGHEQGSLEEYLPRDIHQVKIKEQIKEPEQKISIKSTKFNGIWMDIPGDQFNKSDIFILTKLIISNDHLFSFFKEISVFRDKILKCGIQENCIDEEEADNIFNQIPSFKPVIGYIPGFIVKNEHKSKEPFYEYRFGRTNATIYNYCGEYSEDILEEIKKEIEEKQNKNKIKVSFEGIRSFSKQHKYIFGMKSLKYTKDDWENHIINKL